MDCRKRKRKRGGRERKRRGERKGGREKDRNIGVKGGNAFIYIYGIVDDATRAYIRFEMHKERARGRGINFQWGVKNGRDAFV